MKQTTVPPPFEVDLSYLQPQDIGRLMASLVALGGEVFLLKAEVRRLRQALESRGGPATQDVEAAASTAAYREWLAQEQQDFARALLEPFTAPRPGGSR